MARSLDMTTGRPLPLLLRFTLPTLAGNLLHQAYSITDSVVVGQFLGQTALASVGCTSPIVMLLAALMIGINLAVGILISQYFGRRDYNGIRRAMINSLYLGLAISLILAVAGGSLAEPILRWMGTPDGPLQNAVVYLRINFVTAVCPLFYYLFSSIFRGMGDSRTALYCLVVAALGNVGLDVLFVAVFHWGVAGTAWATALAQALSAVFAAILLWRRFPEIRPRRGDWRLDRRLFGRITGLAVPIALQSAFNNLGNVIAQSGINSFGETVMAAYTAAGRIGFMHLRNVKILEDGSFEERAHLSSCGSLDMYAIVKALVETGFDGYVRPDHGRMIWGETGKPGYGLYDRALGAAYINGLFEACEKAQKGQ